MRIKEVSEHLGIPSSTLRYYEKVGLMRRVEKNPSGIREYDVQDISRLEFIKCMRKADVSIEILKEYIRLYDEEEDTKEQRQKILTQELDTMLIKIETLEGATHILEKKIALIETEKLDQLLKDSIK